MTTVPIRLLLLEDNEGDARLVQAALAEHAPGEFALAWVERLADALARIGAEPFDAMLCDLGLPDSAGIATAQAIVARAPALPLVVLTGSHDQSAGREAIQHGAQNHLVKGESGGALIARTLRYAIERKRLELGLRAANEALERRVAAHTVELETTVAKLHESLSRSSALAEAAADAIITADQEGTIVAWNPAAARLFGYTQAEALGQALTLVIPERYRGEHRIGVNRVRAGGERHIIGKRVELQGLTKAGVEFPLELSLSTWETSQGKMFAAIIHDISERKQAEKNIQKEMSFSQAALDSLPGLFYLFDNQGRFLRFNTNLEKVSGYSADELFQMTPLDLFSETDKGGIAEAIQRVFQTGEATVEADFLSKDQTRTPYFFTGKHFQFDQQSCLIGMGIDISTRMRAEETLRESETRFRSLAAMASDFYWQSDAEHRLLLRGPDNRPTMVPAFVNNAQVGLRRWEIPHLSPDEAGWQAHRALLDAHLPFRDFEASRLGTDGNVQHILIRGDPLFDASGVFKGYLGVGTNITERRRTELALARQKDLYAMLSQTNQTIVRASGAQELFQEVCRIAVEHGRFALAWIGLLDQDQRLEPVARYGRNADYADYANQLRISMDESDPWGRGIIGQTLRSGKYAFNNEILDDTLGAPWQEAARRAGVRALAAFPLRRGGAVIGAVSVYSEEPGFFTEELLATLDEMAADISFALDNFEREVRRKQSLEALRESEVRYHSLFENMLNGFAHCRMEYDDQNRPVDFIYLAVNDAFERLTGLKNVVGKRVTEVIPGIRESTPELFDTYGRVATTGVAETLEIYVEPLRHWFSISVYGLEKGHFVAIFDVITERKRAEQALRAAEERFRSLAAMASDFYWQSDAEHRLLPRGPDNRPTMVPAFVNNAQVGLRRWEIPHLSPDEAGWQAHRALLDAHLPFRDFEASRLGTDGNVQHILIRGDPLFDASGVFKGYLGVGTNITELRLSETKIRRLNRVYAVLSGINALIMRARTRDELFREACNIAVEDGGFRMAWIGIPDREAMRVKPVAWYGIDEDYLRAMPLGLDAAQSDQYGVAGRVVMERKAMNIEDIAEDKRFLVQQHAREHEFKSLVILPILVAGEIAAVIALYAGEVEFFDERGMKLLYELTGDIAFALDHNEKAGRLNYLAFYDPLTGLANRTLFVDRLTQYAHAASLAGDQLALVLIDLDRFRRINESLGRQAGDELLKQFTNRLLRVTDAGELARLSADMFAIVLLTLTGKSEVTRRIESLWQDCFGEPFRLSDADHRVSAKAGVALFPGDAGNVEALFASAEAALDKAKKTGERHVFHSPELTESTGSQLTYENQLRQALEKDEFMLHYQPKVDLDTRRIAGVEALIRWQSPELGLVPPVRFIPLLEETGLIVEVGAWVLSRAIADHTRWTEQGIPAPRVAVNVSAIQLRRQDFLVTLEQALKSGATLPGIDLEITETLIMEDIQGNIEKLKTVRDLGVRIAIDDFGTGYSSLGYLARLPVQTLKIDRSFVITMLDDPNAMTLVSTIISLAHSLRLKVVAEGVETEEQAKMLRLLRCDQMQGYLFSRPLPFEQMTALLTHIGPKV